MASIDGEELLPDLGRAGPRPTRIPGLTAPRRAPLRPSGLAQGGSSASVGAVGNGGGRIIFPASLRFFAPEVPTVPGRRTGLPRPLETWLRHFRAAPLGHWATGPRSGIRASGCYSLAPFSRVRRYFRINTCISLDVFSEAGCIHLRLAYFPIGGTGEALTGQGRQQKARATSRGGRRLASLIRLRQVSGPSPRPRRGPVA